ncbi:MAG: contractile injection system tape measure protein [Lacibacter sp.]
MQEQQIHIIKKASLDFMYSGKEDGFALQKEVKDWLQQFMDQLNTELENYCHADDVITLDQLQLNVNLKSRHWKEDATRQLLFQLKDKLQLLRSGSVADAGYKEIKAAKHFEEEFLFYLEQGFTSWRSNDAQKNNWQERVRQLFMQPDIQFLQQLLQLLKQSDNALIRFKEALPEALIVKLFQPVLKTDEQYLQYSNDVLLLLEQSFYGQEIKGVLQKIHLQITANWPDQAYVKTAVTSFFQHLRNTSAVQKAGVTEMLFQSILFTEAQSKITGKEKKAKGFNEQPQSFFTRKQLLYESALNKQQEEGLVYSPEMITEEGIFISNAGLVVVAAFLPAMFTKLNITTDNEIVHVTDAVCLLHIIATAVTATNETGLVFPKILCGLHPSTAIEVSAFTVSDIMQEEVNNMLSSVIEYWNVLGDTSVKGLQESFLQRDGKLLLHNGEWILKVEQQPFDMLLQHLPWNMTMIQLPWMKQMLKTEWFF